MLGGERILQRLHLRPNINLLKLAIGKDIYTIISLYAP